VPLSGYSTIELEVRGHTACITLNRPERLNAINDEMIREINEAYRFVEDSEDIWTLIITGKGRALCTGADVQKAHDHNDEVFAPGIDTQGDPLLSSARQWDAPQEATPPWLAMTKPIVCAVNGLCCGAGLDLVTVADIPIAATDAEFFDPHVSIGVTPGREVARLARVLPMAVAMRMALMGRHERMSAQCALQYGLVTELVEPDRLVDRAWEIAEIVNRNAPLAVRGARLAIRKGIALPIYEAELLAENYRMKTALTQDAIEGPAAFMEKRDPTWKAR
jgi:enoyl-CoA hydratase/carnithine racemase